MANDINDNPVIVDESIEDKSARILSTSDDLEITLNRGRPLFYPFADMIIEFYPGNHAWIEQSFSTQPDINKGDRTITEFDNPFEDEPILLAFGRGCMRFVVTKDGMQGLIDHLTELQDQMENDAPLNPNSGPTPVATEGLTYARHDAKQDLTGDEPGPADRDALQSESTPQVDTISSPSAEQADKEHGNSSRDQNDPIPAPNEDGTPSSSSS